MRQAIIDWYRTKRPTSRFLVTVYDEINITAPRADWKADYRIAFKNGDAVYLDGYSETSALRAVADYRKAYYDKVRLEVSHDNGKEWLHSAMDSGDWK